MDGWKEDLSVAREPSDLPIQAMAYIKKIEETTGVPVNIVSIGASRERVVYLKELFS
jgi:adenylosuccinate synthase